MGAPNVSYVVSQNKISSVQGYNGIFVTFSADAPYLAFECRATKAGEDWGVGVGSLVAAFSQTPAGTERTFEVYDDYLLKGDGVYNILLYVQGEDGSWNDTIAFFTADAEALHTTDGYAFLPRKGDVHA